MTKIVGTQASETNSKFDMLMEQFRLLNKRTSDTDEDGCQQQQGKVPKH